MGLKQIQVSLASARAEADRIALKTKERIEAKKTQSNAVTAEDALLLAKREAIVGFLDIMINGESPLN